MTILFSAVIYLVLLIFIRQTWDKLHPLISVIFAVVFIQWLFRQQWVPLMTRFVELTTALPYSRALLYTVSLLMLSGFITKLLEEHDYEALAEVVLLSVRILLITFWLQELTPAFQHLMNLFERLQPL